MGQQILLDMMEQQGVSDGNVHEDCGILIYDPETQDTHSGGSGCGCSASVLAGYILPKIIRGEWKKVLFVPTGALMSKVSFYEGSSVPGIAQAVILEGLDKEETDGVYQCILDGRSDLCAGADPFGQNKADAGQDYGSSGMFGGVFECGRILDQPLVDYAHGGATGPAHRIWASAVSGSEGSSG